MLEEHEDHLKWVFNQLWEHKLFLSSNLKKIDVYSTWMDCLGFIIDDKGIHIDPSKIDKILEWRMPCSYHDVQKFNGVIQYISQFLPNVTKLMSWLTRMCSNHRDFVWTGFQDNCFWRIKELVYWVPICKQISSKVEEPIWIIMDASATGVSRTSDACNVENSAEYHEIFKLINKKRPKLVTITINQKKVEWVLKKVCSLLLYCI